MSPPRARWPPGSSGFAERVGWSQPTMEEQNRRMSTTGASRPTFTTTRFREGYAVGDVDAFLDTVFTAISTGQPVPPIATAVFRPVRMANGYDMDEVDAFLDELEAGLAR